MSLDPLRPSPTGFLHLGHAFSALTAWRRAREAGGRFLLRLEDIDPAAAGRTSLPRSWRIWPGWGWTGTARCGCSRRISPTIASCWTRWRCAGWSIRASARGRTSRARRRSAAAPHGPDGGPLYPGTCRASPEARAARLAAGRRTRCAWTWRGRWPGPLYYEEEGEGLVACDPARFGDAVLARKDAPCSYHLCVTHDDACKGSRW